MIASKEVLSIQTEQIWEAYPKKIGRPTALRAIRQAITKHGFELVLQRTRLYAQTYNGETQYMPNPSTFFHQERFLDNEATWRRSGSTNGKVQPPRKFDSANYHQPTENL